MTNTGLGALITSLLFLPSLVVAGDNHLSSEVNIHVAVLSPPCDISPSDQPLRVDFGHIGYKRFYEGDMPEAPFTLHLTDCDTSVAKSVRFTFSGDENASLPGKLAFDTSSAAQGVAIGIKSPDGGDFIINKQSSAYVLNNGDMSFDFVAYLQAEPKAVSEQKIVPGIFSATAVLNLVYE